MNPVAVLVPLLALAGAVLWFALPLIEWRERWARPLLELPDGTRVRLAPGASPPNLGRLRRVVAELRATEELRPMRFWVELVPIGEVRTPTVPDGRLPDGTVVGGSVRWDRPLPFWPAVPVAVVTYQAPQVTPARLEAFIVHEITRHALARWLGDEYADPDHERDDLAELEARVLRRLHV